MPSRLQQLKANRVWLGLLVSILLFLIWPLVAPPLLALVLIDFLMMRSLAQYVQVEKQSDFWGLPAVVLTGLILWVQFQLLTRGTSLLFQPELLGTAYDSLASSLLAGTTELNPTAIRWEAMERDGRVYMYFGPWPAILRIPLGLWVEPLSGLWSRLSCFVASALALAAFIRLALRSLHRNQRLDSANASLLFLASILAFGLGTPLVFLTISGSIYHESILWGLAASIWALDFAWVILHAEDSSYAALWGLSCSAGIALLSRLTFGAPLMGILAICIFSKWIQLGRRAGARKNLGLAIPIFATILPALTAIIFQVWYNVDRFDSPVIFARLDRLEYLLANRESWTSFEAWGSLNPRRIPVAFLNYLGFQSDFFASSFPWVRATRAWYPDPNVYPQMFDSLVISLTLASPCVVFGSLLGFVWLFRFKGEWLLKICALGLFTQCVFVFSYFIMEQRYTADFLPFLVWGYALFLRGPSAGKPSRISNAWLANGALLLALVSTSTTMMSSISVIPRHGAAQPRAYRQDWVERFGLIDALLGISENTHPDAETRPE